MLRLGLLERADGSASLSDGVNGVLVSVHGPMSPPSSKQELIDKATVEVTLQPFGAPPSKLRIRSLDLFRSDP